MTDCYQLFKTGFSISHDFITPDKTFSLTNDTSGYLTGWSWILEALYLSALDKN